MQQMRDCFYLFILFCYKLDLPNFRKFSISERYVRQRIQIVRLDCLWFPEIETASSLSRVGKLHAYMRVSEDTPLKGRTESFKVEKKKEKETTSKNETTMKYRIQNSIPAINV